MCAYALNLAGIRKVVYGCDNDKFGGNGSILSLQKFDPKTPSVLKYSVQSGVCKDESVELLQRFYEHGNEKVPLSKR
jgi:tRNA-specific adenosine deaminase 2